MALTPGSYTQTNGTEDTTYFQDCAIGPATINDGTLFQRFDLTAYPQVGVTLTGTNATTGEAVPLAARTFSGAGS